MSAILIGLALTTPAAEAQQVKEEKAEGYAEFRVGPDVLVVDGQRVKLSAGAKFKGEGEAKAGFGQIPLGYEVKAKGRREAGGVLLARELEAKPNGSALFEREVKEATDSAEYEYRKAGSFYQSAGNGRIQVIGRLHDAGPDVERVRAIVDGLIPPYLDPDAVRSYVIDNEEWNAFAMGNYSIYVFSGLLDDMDDDEVAIVLGHELAHATHEHTRRQFKKQMWIQLLALGVVGAAESVDDKNKRAVIDLLAVFGATAWSNGYGRDLEDQADRVGLRYAYEAGYDITKGPRLWTRFAKKYGESGKVANFFFSDHSLSSARARNLERELALNYPEGAKESGPRLSASARKSRRSDPSRAAAPAPGAVRALASTPSSGRKEIKPGMTLDQVRSLLGKPQEEIVFGNRRKWVYPNSSVTFENGKVTDVEF
jgi:hypothetical protein